MTKITRAVRELSEDTKISIGLAVAILGGVAWLTTLWNKVEAMEVAQTEQTSDSKEILQRLSRIEGALGVSGDVLVIPITKDR